MRAIVKNTNEVLSVATLTRFEEVPEPVYVGIPVRLGWAIGSSLYNILSDKEKKGITEAAKAIYETYQKAIETI